MKTIKKLYLTLIIAIILIIISCFSINNIINVLADDKTDNNSATEISYEYILKTYNGKIGVYNSDNTLEKVYDIYVNTLPKQDIDMLTKGIKIKDTQELNSYIRDFDS